MNEKIAYERFCYSARIDGEAAWGKGEGAHLAGGWIDVNKPLIADAVQTTGKGKQQLRDAYLRHWRYGWLNGLAARVRGLNLPDDGR